MKNTTELIKNQMSIIPISNRLEGNLLLEKYLITSNLAKMLLSRMVKNRNIKQNNIDELADTINSGYWDSENGETIKIREDGKVTDGQHRLKAIIKSNKAVECYVIFNTSINSMTNVDTGISRSLSDIFKIEGHQYYIVKPGIITSEQGIINGIPSKDIASKNKFKSWQKILNIGNKNNDYLTFICKSSYQFRDLFPLISVMIYAKYYNIFYKIDKYKADEFMEEITSSHSTNESVILLKKKLIQDTVATIKISRTHKEALLIKCWNNFIEHKKIKRLNWNLSLEKYPKIKGIEKITNKFK